MSGHKAKALRITTGLGSWQAMCACGWEGPRYYTTGARTRARFDADVHEDEAAEVPAATGAASGQ